MLRIDPTSRAAAAVRSIKRAVGSPDRARSRSRGGVPDTAPASKVADPRVAACALLLELAHADERFCDVERGHVSEEIRRQFGLCEQGAGRLLDAAEDARATASGVWQFTNAIALSYSVGQKALLAEMMRELAHADGERTSQETYVVRMVCSLLRVEPAWA